MATRSVLTCYECKEKFPREQLVAYSSPNSVTQHNYCPKCLEEKIERDKFSEEVCRIFGLKAPSARIWAERKRIQEQYGYTDGTIIDCLKYVYEINDTKKLSTSLCLVTPTNVEKMLKMKRRQAVTANHFESALNMKYNKQVLSYKESPDREKIHIDIDSVLNE